jgi:hypothetical protein
MKILYLAKEPDQGVKSDLAELSQLGEVTVVACNPGYLDYFRKIDYNCITKDVFFELDGSMKFDYIIGNPPYQDATHKAKTSSLWKKFLEQCFELSTNTVSLIIPASFTSPSTLFAKYKRHLKKLDLTVKKHFKGVGSSFCMITLTKEEQPTCEVVSDGGTYQIDFTDWDCVPSYLDDEIMSLVDKYFIGESLGWKTSYEYDQRKKYISDTEGSIEILHSTRSLWTDHSHPNNDKIRVYCTSTNGTKFGICPPGKGLSQLYIWTEVSSLEYAETLVQKLNTPEVSKLLKVFQYSNMNYPKIIDKLNIK